VYENTENDQNGGYSTHGHHSSLSALSLSLFLSDL